jgi:hypothetical protein
MKHLEWLQLEVLKWLKEAFNITEEDAKSVNNLAFTRAASLDFIIAK